MAKKPATKEPKEAPKTAVNFFTKAQKTATGPKEKKSKGTTFQLPDDEKQSLSKAVANIIKAHGAEKEAKAQAAIAKGIVMPAATDLIVKKWAELGVEPDGPLDIVSANGDSLTYIVQDKTQVNTWSDEQHADLAALLGKDAADACIETREVFSLNPNVLAEEGVIEKLSAAISNCGLTESQAADLLKCDRSTFLKKGSLDRLAEIAGRDTVRMGEMLSILGSACVRYLKV